MLFSRQVPSKLHTKSFQKGIASLPLSTRVLIAQYDIIILTSDCQSISLQAFTPELSLAWIHDNATPQNSLGTSHTIHIKWTYFV